ncbi:hypothetical protein HJFPF1_02533 [Paramyrothecium foliicola]|nr:hypothetical protein HJFPF1_02533 [Paramyrothecium foliicola]
MAQASVAVQPPAWAQAETSVYPHVIGKLTVRPADPSVYYFAMASLVDTSGGATAEGLNGITTITGTVLDGSNASRETVVFPFFETSVSDAGNFRVRLDIYKISYGSPDGATLVAQVQTNSFGVSKSPVPSYRPSSEERQFIRKLRDAGISASASSDE